MKRLLCFAILCSLLLCACGGEAPAPTTEPTVTNEATTEPTSEPTEPTEPPVLYRNPLNGEPLNAPFTGRATAVVINNIKDCLPQYGIGDADLYFEVETEGYITRCVAVYSDISTAGTIGPVRSARTYFNSIGAAYNAPLVHCGGSPAALAGNHADGEKLSKWAHINESYNGKYFFRDNDRYNYQGYAWEHTLFTKGESMAKAMEDLEYASQEVMDYGYTFSEDAAVTGETANKVVITFPGNKTTTMEYSAETGLYGMSQYGSETKDTNTGYQVTFKNVITLYTSHWKKDDNLYYRSYYDLLGEGKGYLAMNGVITEITWSRDSVDKPFVFKLTDGTPVTLGVGSTYIGISSNKADPISYE